MKLMMGIDGGATKTRVIIGDESGNILGYGESGGTNLGSVSAEMVSGTLVEAISQAIGAINISPARIAYAFAGLAGVVSQKDKDMIEEILAGIGVVAIEKIGVHHDIHAALRGGFAGGPGIDLIAGTGSSCYGVNSEGKSWFGGGWGHLVDDGGSGYFLSVKAFKAAVREKDGRGQATKLTPKVFDYLKISDVTDIIRRLHFEGFSGPGTAMTKDQIAGFAPQVIATAEEGDEIAIGIVDEGVDELILMLKNVVENLDLAADDQRLILTGSVINNPYMKKMFNDKVKRMFPDIKICKPEFSPVVGAFIEALLQEGIAVSVTIHENLKKYTEKTTTQGRNTCL